MFAPQSTRVFALTISLTVVVEVFAPSNMPSTLDAVLMQTSPAGMTLTPPAVRMVMSAASSLSRQSHRGEVRARRSEILSPCLARLWRSLSTTMSTASA